MSYLYSYITPDSIKDLTDKEIYFKYRKTDTIIGDSKTISYITSVIERYAKKENY